MAPLFVVIDALTRMLRPAWAVTPALSVVRLTASVNVMSR
jgi:hypothetical protein